MASFSKRGNTDVVIQSFKYVIIKSANIPRLIISYREKAKLIVGIHFFLYF